jgi:NADH-quinone oxidoreductase subunit N
VSFDYLLLTRALLPEIALVIGALVVLGYDLTLGRKLSDADRLSAALGLGGIATIAALVDAVLVGRMGPVYGATLMLDSLAVATRIGVLALTLLTLGIAAGARTPRHPAEYVAIILFATAGFTLMAAANHLLVAFAALELASISLYILAGYDKSRLESAEAALKYFLYGAMAAAFLLFGFSLIYGLTGELELGAIAIMLAHTGMSPLLGIALVMVLVAFGFKAAAAPFHLWAPDAYEGAPTPSAALIASASKLAGFALFLRLLWPGLGAAAGGSPGTAVGWLTPVAIIVGASLLLGNLAALAQGNVRRLLAYSAIAHAGAMLLGVMAAGVTGPGPLFYYAATYGVAAAGAFGVVAVLEANGGCQRITDLAGLARRSPFLAGCLAVFILSLAGIPPLAGFFGKFVIFAGALQVGGLSAAAGWLALLAIAMGAVAFYYYLIVLKQALVIPAAIGASRIRVPFFTGLMLLLGAMALVVLGALPTLVLRYFG